MKKKIVILSAFLTPFRSGAEACAEEVPLQLFDQYDFTIITARLRSDLQKHDHLQGKIPVIRVGVGSSIDKWLFPFLAPFAARKLKPTIIHAILESYAGLAMILCKLIYPKAKRILTCQSTNTTLLVGSMHRSADQVTAISSVLIERAKKFGRSDTILIPNGISLEEITKVTKAAVKIPGRILFVGRLEPMKGVETLLDAFAKVAKEFPEANLRVVGDGSLRLSLVSRHKGLIENGRITFAGYIPAPEVYREFASAEIFCGLSRSEALGNVFLEAQAAGCAVIATRVGGIPDVVEHDKTGLLIKPDTANEAAQVLGELLKDTLKRESLAREGQKNAEKYDWSVIAEKYAEMYQIN